MRCLKPVLAGGTAFAMSFWALSFGSMSAMADEGMWTFDNAPLAKINQAYGLHLDQAWLDRLQHAAVRLSVGCSASVVSPNGLVFTNHHCVVECAQNLSAADHDFVANGYMAATKEDEKACPGMAAEILTGISDVTKEVNAATAGLTGDTFVKAQNARQTEIEKAACGKDIKLHCQVVTLYQGGQYKLYTYRKYNDIRLVFAPEFQAAFFGGDPDNFNFPRYGLDCGFLRLYENGKAVKTPEFLKWNPAAPKDDEPTFIAGNPGMTHRLQTAAELETQRDLVLPFRLITLSEQRGRLIRFSEESEDNRRNTAGLLFGLENGFKVYSGQQLALTDPKLIAAKKAAEADLQAKVPAELKAEIGDPWADMAAIQGDYRSLYMRYYFMESALNASDLFYDARLLVRAADERRKPSAERLPEYADSRLGAMKDELLAAAPIFKPRDQVVLETRLSKAREYLTADAPETRVLLGKASPEVLSKFLIDGTHLDDPRVRQALWDGGWDAVQTSTDPMIQYALKIDAEARAKRSHFEAKVTGPTRIAAEKIARARFAVYGTQTYPDATFTLRLSYGKVAGWTHDGETVAPFTDFKGLYGRATGQFPFVLAKHFAEAEGKFDESTVFDYVTTNDITGGNSGSPVINAKGEVIGAAFDGNIYSIGGDYAYDGSLNRTVVVSTAAVTMALDKVYNDQVLLKELTRQQSK